MTIKPAALACLLALCTVTGAAAQGAASGQMPSGKVPGGKIPIERDLERSDRIDHRLGLPDPLDRPDTARLNSSVTPTNPSGVAGFDGPPGVIGDSVNSYSPLPPGAPGNEVQ